MARYVPARATAVDKQQRRREAIIDTAAQLLRAEGFAACSVRRVAAELELSPSAIYYYFSDIQELADAAYDALTDAYFGHLEAMRGTFDDPLIDFWHAAASYLQPWSVHHQLPLLWSEYYAFSGRNNRTEGVTASFRRTVTLFESFLAPIGDAGLTGRAEAVWRHANGAVLSRGAFPVDLEVVLGEIALIVGTAPPRAADIRCGRPACWCAETAPSADSEG
jgi:AcrR family transcriptional regulator